MKNLLSNLVLLAGGACMLLQPAFAQGVASPLGLQGLDNSAAVSARTRAMGGAAAAAGNDATGLFSNPASLGRVEGLQLFVGGAFQAGSYAQEQQWIPNRLYAGLSLLFENRLAGIKDSALQKPLDNISPDWTKNTSAFRPAMAAAAIPLNVSGFRLVAGLGFRQAAQMDDYYQNNNALNPNLGSFREEIILRPTPGDSVGVQWYQFVRQRKGAIYGITPALALEAGGGLTVAGSVTILTGSTDDSETRLSRGLLTLLTSGSGSFNVFRLAPQPYLATSVGTSKFKGILPTLGALYHQETFSLGISLALPATITRTYTGTLFFAGSEGIGTALATMAGEEKLKLPFSYTFGLALHPSASVDVAVDYDVRRYGGATLSGTASSTLASSSTLPLTSSLGTTNPWLGSSLFHLGLEYRPASWLAVRGGYREDVQVFAPEGEGLLNEPVHGSAYSAGLGFRFGSLLVDVAYELSHVRYQDIWVSNINTNTRDRHTVLLQLGVLL